MNNDITIFNNEQFGDLRVIMQDDEPWFMRNGVCRALEITNPNDATASLDEDEKGVAIADTPGGKQEVAIISEAGLYSLILRSRKPQAKAFKRWITHEVLPQIRKTGGYIPVKPDDDEMMIVARGWQIMQRTIDQQSAKIAADAPKVETYDLFLTEAADEIPMAILANRLQQEGIDMGLKRLFAFLRDKKVLCSKGHRKNLPTQKYMEKGWFTIKSPQPNTPVEWKPSLFVTPKGISEITIRARDFLTAVTKPEGITT